MDVATDVCSVLVREVVMGWEVQCAKVDGLREIALVEGFASACRR